MQEAADEEAQLKAQEELKAILEKKMQAELAVIRANPEYMLGVTPKELEKFSPDGDGVNDTITFAPVTLYLTKPAKKWSLKIIDPAGNDFRNWSGEGNPPAKIIWDGMSNDGEVVSSYNTYKALFKIIPSDEDKEYLGMDKMRDGVEGKVEIKTDVVLKKIANNEWKIEMTSVPFDPNAASFNQLTRAQIEKLRETVNEVYEKIVSIGENASVSIYGYANNISGTEQEDQEELISLSQKRAEIMAYMLIQRGLSSDSVTAVGRGGADPIASR
ncbi:MAG: OmpA family protein [Treponema sp.]|nr:OmpA family protein [Treponema sp.]